jgi:hypothetical protein
MMTRRIRLSGAIAFVCVVFVACGGKPPTSPGTGDVITGSERFGWDQPAADAGELATFRYAMYVDEARGEAADVTCDPASTGGRFACTSRLPSMPNGMHTLQVAAFVIDAGAVRESARSASVRVVKR